MVPVLSPLAGPSSPPWESAVNSSPRPAHFAGKVVIVTGGSKGIGRAVAQAFARAGARVVLAGRNLETAHAAASAISAETGACVRAVATNIAIPTQCADLIASATRLFDRADILINNAAYFARAPLLDQLPDEAVRMLGTNLLGALCCGQAFARWKLETGGSGVIVNMSSISGSQSTPGYGLYAASKAALDSLTKSMAVEWAAHGIRVNGVAPGHVRTDDVRKDIASGRLDGEALLHKIPDGRLADVSDVADLVLFLASDESRHIHGQTITIDGGETAML